MRINFLGVIFAAVAINCQTIPAAAANGVHQFPKGYWIENIAIRSNGALLLTRMDKAEVHTLDPLTTGSTPKLVHAFPGAISCMGIAENTPDNFAVIVTSFQGFSQKSDLWNVDVSAPEAKATKVSQTSISAGLNGLALLSPNIALATDTMGGDIYRIDLKNGTSSVIYKAVGRGVNGVRVKGKYVYYSNLITGDFSRLPIDPTTGSATGPAESLGNVGMGADDFALSPFAEEAFVVNQMRNQVVRIELTGSKKVSVLAGSQQSGTIFGPTSAQMGRTAKDDHVLYVTTSAGSFLTASLPDAGAGGGKVVAVKV